MESVEYSNIEHTKERSVFERISSSIVGKGPALREPHRRRFSHRRRRNNESRPDVNSEWKHDKYQEDEEMKDKATEEKEVIKQAPEETKPRTYGCFGVNVTNIHWEVTDDEFKKVFEGSEGLLNAQITYDRSGRSTEEGVVNFETLEDAQKAIEKFQNVQLNGQQLCLNLCYRSKKYVVGDRERRPRRFQPYSN